MYKLAVGRPSITYTFVSACPPACGCAHEGRDVQGSHLEVMPTEFTVDRCLQYMYMLQKAKSSMIKSNISAAVCDVRLAASTKHLAVGAVTTHVSD